MASSQNGQRFDYLNRLDILKCLRLPARLSAEETAQLLGFQPHDIPVLITAKVLTPLGDPVPTAPKWFSAVELLRLCNDSKLLSKATKAVSLRWKKRNDRKGKNGGEAQAA